MKALDYHGLSICDCISHYSCLPRTSTGHFALRCSGDKMDPRQLPVMFSNPRMCNPPFFLGKTQAYIYFVPWCA